MGLTGREARILRAAVAELLKRGIGDDTLTQKPSLGRAQEYCQRVIDRSKDERIVDNAKERMALLVEAKDPTVQQRELDRCRKSFVYWLTYYAWTFDPRGKTLKTLPFVPFDYQVEAAEWILKVRQANREGIVEKARDMGATWLFVAYFTWCWLFESEFIGLFASRKVNMVDAKGDPNSIMQKARMLLWGLPLWMVPEGYDESKHALKQRIINPANGSVMVGEGGNQIGRGGRATIVLVDESAFIPRPEAVESALSETSEVKFWLSTPNAPGDWFARRRHSQDFVGWVLTLRWKRDPRKNAWQAIGEDGTVVATGSGDSPAPEVVGARTIIYPWYEGAKARFSDPARMAREVDIDYTASSDRLVFPWAWIQAAINLDIGDMGEVTECGADMSGSGVDKDIWTMRRGGAVVTQKLIERPNPTLIARAMLMATEAVGGRVLHYDAGGGYGGALSGEHDPETNGGKRWKFILHGVQYGGRPTMRRFGDRPARELFTNYKAELYWSVRERFRRSYELSLWRSGDPTGVPHDPTDCISIPDDPELHSQLASILSIETSTGKIQLESKESMKERGVKSPDKADSLVNSFAPTPVHASDEGAASVSMGG